MAWTEITRRHYRRDGMRYASDLTDDLAHGRGSQLCGRVLIQRIVHATGS